jgi:hypothetical protein
MIKVRSFRSSMRRIYYKFNCSCGNEPSLQYNYMQYDYFYNYVRKDLMKTGCNGITCTKCWKHYQVDLINLVAEEVKDQVVFKEKHGVFK